MKNQLEAILKNAEADLEKAQNINDIEEIKLKYLSRKGELNSIKKNLKDLSVEDKKVVGAFANEVAQKLENEVKVRYDEFYKKELDEKLKCEKIDVTLPGKNIPMGRIHPITETINEITEIFHTLGFSVAPDKNSPEVETEYYHFDHLNFPKDHPARDMQDTFYTTLAPNVILRGQTSGAQVRVMEDMKPPIRIIAPGRVYRNDYDMTHTPMFHQVEGLLVEEHTSFAELKGVLNEFLLKFFEEELEVRFRPSFFPFTEPSAEVDLRRKGGKWLEVLGCGMVHPNVLRNVGIDTDKYVGYAFGMGVERLTMLRYGVNDLRAFFENDLRFLKQFA
ncbi:MAG: phenylalanine--tRNA ligase subunit alpha [Succinivibrio sp.]|nr:phenylalanine--tRNA ligase subunit alpha [Succinivibrio sp.]